MRETLRVPPHDPTEQERVPREVHHLPWDDLRDLVEGTALVLGALRDLPAGWSTSDDAGHAAVVVVDPTDDEELRRAHAAAAGRPLVVVAANVARPTFVRALLVGRGDGLLPGRGRLTPDRLDRALATLGRRPRPPAPRPGPELTGRPLDDLLTTVSATAGWHDGPWLVRGYDLGRPDPTASPQPVAPFLSVLVRTQGRRPEALADVLLCLSAQTCSDVEVLLLAHDIGAEERSRLDQQVAGLPTGLRSRVRVVTVEGGGRTRPLTVGTSLATGRYLAVLDDDDLVLGHWVETFRTAAEASPGRIVRSVAVEQDMEPVAGDAGHRAASWPHARWDTEFSMLSHLVDNHSPVHCYAYPREVFSELGLRFDERLPVLEDWDLLVRAAALVGVRDTGEVTAVYRRWPAALSSFSEVAETQWPETAWQVVSGWDRTPLLLPAGSATRLRTEGIYLLRHPPLRTRVERRISRWRDRFGARLIRTPVGPALRWVYRRLPGSQGEAA